MANVRQQSVKTELLNTTNTGSPIVVPLPPESRELTAGEISLAKLMFKDSIPYKKVRIVRGELLGMPDHSENAMTPFGEIHLPSKKYDEIKDFSRGTEEEKRWFIHEMAHVWQYFAMDICVACRGVGISTKGGYLQKHPSGRLMAYFYDLLGADAKKEFKDFNIEQQADIICHYFLVKYHKSYVVKLSNLPTLLAEQSRREYVLRDFLKNPLDKKLKSVAWGWGESNKNKIISKRAIAKGFYRKGRDFYSF
ncbi:hypothetical protein [Neisseria sicca]|jgi:hypothetical protein|uniref:hypothetical protein n=1 Tax=Neisseria sicca TaxID=490 RepID=UPI000669B2E7|nr:hypothetical protein [Neisseria sicca]